MKRLVGIIRFFGGVVAFLGFCAMAVSASSLEMETMDVTTSVLLMALGLVLLVSGSFVAGAFRHCTI